MNRRMHKSYATFLEEVTMHVLSSHRDEDPVTVRKVIQSSKPKMITENMKEAIHLAHYHRRTKVGGKVFDRTPLTEEDIRKGCEDCSLCDDALNVHMAYWISTAEKELARRAVKREKARQIVSFITCDICTSDDIALKDANQCSEGHLFCMDCARRMAEIEIGMQRVKMSCMSMGGCEAEFTESEMRRFLKPKTMELWVCLKGKEDIDSAKIQGLVHCPFCEYAVIIDEDEAEETFDCGNPECLIVSCLTCKRTSHLGQTCEDARLRGTLCERRRAEEQLAQTLIRYCPNCSLALLKEENGGGCNKMVCTKCNTSSCYVCRKDMGEEGYDHFATTNQDRRALDAGRTCPMYDDTANRHAVELADIRKNLDARFADI